MEQKEIEALIDKLVTKENKLIVRKIEVNLIKGSFGNPKISVGTLPHYEWQKDKKITYVITSGRYLDCSMLCYEQYKGDKDYTVTKSYKKAKQIVRDIILKYIEKEKETKEEIKSSINEFF